MKQFVGQTADGAYRIVIEGSALQAIDKMCAAAGTRETGGILVGRYTNDNTTALVLEATAPPNDSRTGGTWFVRGIAGLRQLLARRWSDQTKSHYVGEWHYHPARIVVPSGDDWAQMASIARLPKYQCREPILVIAGQQADELMSRPLRAFVCPVGLGPLELIARQENVAGATEET